MKLFKMVKNIKIKILICYMVDEMVKKWGRASFYLSCNCTLCFLVKILLVKLKSLHTSACLNLNCGRAKQNAKIWRVQRWWNLSKLLTNTLTNFNLGLFFSSLIVPPPPPPLRIEIDIQKILLGGNGWWWEPVEHSCLGDISKNK